MNLINQTKEHFWSLTTKLLWSIAYFYVFYLLEHVRGLPKAIWECQAPLMHVEEHVRQTYQIVSTALFHKVHRILAAES